MHVWKSDNAAGVNAARVVAVDVCESSQRVGQGGVLRYDICIITRGASNRTLTELHVTKEEYQLLTEAVQQYINGVHVSSSPIAFRVTPKEVK